MLLNKVNVPFFGYILRTTNLYLRIEDFYFLMLFDHSQDKIVKTKASIMAGKFNFKKFLIAIC